MADSITSGKTCRSQTAAALVLALLVFAGCTTAREHQSSEPKLERVFVSVDTSTLSLPLDPYQTSPSQHSTINNARNILVQECMRSQGFDMPVPFGSTDDEGRYRLRYGVPDVATARRYGFAGPPDPNSAAIAEFRANQPKLSPEAQLVLTGSAVDPVSRGGCFGAALDELRAQEHDKDEFLLARLQRDATKLALVDSRVQAVFRHWSDCMAKNGYNYKTPWDAWDDPRWRGPTEPAPEEISAAVSDAECKKGAAVLETWVAVESAYQEIAIEENSDELREIQNRTQESLRRAADVVNSKPSTQSLPS